MLLNKDQIAERMATSPSIASSLLLEHGVRPVDLGRGRGRGKRWYASAVDAVIFRLHEDAQEKKVQPRSVRVGPHLVLGKTSRQLYRDLYPELTEDAPAQ